MKKVSNEKGCGTAEVSNEKKEDVGASLGNGHEGFVNCVGVDQMPFPFRIVGGHRIGRGL